MRVKGRSRRAVRSTYENAWRQRWASEVSDGEQAERTVPLPPPPPGFYIPFATLTPPDWKTARDHVFVPRTIPFKASRDPCCFSFRGGFVVSVLFPAASSKRLASGGGRHDQSARPRGTCFVRFPSRASSPRFPPFACRYNGGLGIRPCPPPQMLFSSSDPPESPSTRAGITADDAIASGRPSQKARTRRHAAALNRACRTTE